MTFKGIIQYGTDYTPAEYAAQATYNAAQDVPLDGAVVKVMSNSGALGLSSREVSTDMFGGQDRWELSHLTDSIGYLASRAAKGWGRPRYNFAKLQIANRENHVIDWFENGYVDNLIHNFDVLGQFVKESGLVGIWFDAESYLPVWTYNQMSQKAKYSLSQYRTQVRSIGREIAARWRSHNPDMHVMTTDAYDGYAAELPEVNNGSWTLWKDFLDGMFDSWGDHTTRKPNQGIGKIILTHEILYANTTPDHVVRYGVNKLINNFDAFDPPINPAYGGGSQYFNSEKEIGLALWIDYGTFDPLNPLSNHWTPTTFKEQLGRIVDTCEWAWIYNQTYKFYGGSNLIPAAYTDKIRELRSEKGLL